MFFNLVLLIVIMLFVTNALIGHGSPWLQKKIHKLIKFCGKKFANLVRKVYRKYCP